MENGHIKSVLFLRKWLRIVFSGMLCLLMIAAYLPSISFAENDISTQMPILVMSLPGIAEQDNDYFFDGAISAYDGSEENSLQDAPTLSQQVGVRNMTSKTNSSAQKCDYFLRFETAEDLLGLGRTTEYILLGSRNDKSLIRNYLGYQIAARVMENAPRVQLCELFIRTESGDQYQGVYLLVEKNTPDTAFLFYHGEEENGISIDTYSTLNDVASGNMYIPFMESAQWDDRYSDIIGNISVAENALYSSNSAVFYTYSDLFDVPSFISRFILGELMQDYIGTSESYFYYDTAAGRVSTAPLWNFDRALDNQTRLYANVTDLQYDEAFYYQQLFRSHQFATQVQSEYLSLRRDALSEKSLMQLVDEAAAYVAPAVERDWERWSSYSRHTLASVAEVAPGDASQTEAVFFSRQTATFEEEILRIKYQLREHSLHMAYDLTTFDFSEKEISKEIVLNTNPVWIFLFLLVFFSLVRFARRYGV